MKNIKELRESLVDNYLKTKAGKMDINNCKTLANTAGKVMETVRIELQLMKLNGKVTDIEFLDTTTK
jgi:hypothetical protein